MMKRRGLSKKRTAPASDAPRKRRTVVGDDAFDWSKGSKGGADNDVIASESEDDNGGSEDGDDATDDEHAREDPQDKRMRLAREYLGKIAEQEGVTSDNDGEDGDADGVEDKIGARLHQDALEALGKLFKPIASRFEEFEFDEDSTRMLRGHRLSVTSLCLSDDGTTAFSAAKDGSLLRWDLVTQTKTKVVVPLEKKGDKKKDVLKDCEKCILAVAMSSDGKFLATGGADKIVRVWNAETAAPTLLESFAGHRDAVSSLCFRLRSHSLFSGSTDRSIKHWNLTEMGYVETLYGHQGEVNALDSLYKERIVSCGRDRSVRMWKIPEETQLVFFGNSGSMDCVKMITDEYYVTGGDDGSLSLWFNGRKKPVCVIHHAHGQGNWISSVAVMPRTDLVASGSCDGSVRLWRADLRTRTLEPVGAIPVAGYVNAMCFDRKKRFLLAGVGQEHRLGRWERIKDARNGLALIALPIVDADDE